MKTHPMTFFIYENAHKKPCPIARSLYSMYFIFILSSILACSDSNKNDGGYNEPFDPNQPVKIFSFEPDSGGMSTNVMIDGNNFGTDPSKIKVYFNKKEAAVVSVKGTKIYAITPRLPGDVCVISVVVGKDSLCFDETFRYYPVARVTTVAGNPGRDEIINGSLLSAGFKDPRYLAIDAEDNIFVSERSNAVFRRINLGKGEVSTVKGSGFVGGNLNVPTVDANGKVVVVPMNDGYTFYEFNPDRLWEGRKFEVIRADDSKPFSDRPKQSVATCQLDKMMYYRNVSGEIIKFDPVTREGWLITSGINPGAEGYGVFSPLQPNLLFIAYKDNRHIGVYDVLTNEYKPYAGLGKDSWHQDGELADAAFGQMEQICFDKEGNMFISDMANNCIRKISPEGVVSTVTGNAGKAGYQDGDPTEALFRNPSGIAVLSDGTIYIADSGNKCIRKLTIE